jgi:methyltransferase-like protein
MPGKYLRRNSSTAYRIINGAALVVGASEGKLRTLNNVGTFIWELADGQHTLEEIIDRVCQEFDVDYSVAKQDAEAFVKELESKNMLVLTDSPVKLEEKP